MSLVVAGRVRSLEDIVVDIVADRESAAKSIGQVGVLSQQIKFEQAKFEGTRPVRRDNAIENV